MASMDADASIVSFFGDYTAFDAQYAAVCGMGPNFEAVRRRRVLKTRLWAVFPVSLRFRFFLRASNRTRVSSTSKIVIILDPIMTRPIFLKKIDAVSPGGTLSEEFQALEDSLRAGGNSSCRMCITQML